MCFRYKVATLTTDYSRKAQHQLVRQCNAVRCDGNGSNQATRMMRFLTARFPACNTITPVAIANRRPAAMQSAVLRVVVESEKKSTSHGQIASMNQHRKGKIRNCVRCDKGGMMYVTDVGFISTSSRGASHSREKRAGAVVRMEVLPPCIYTVHETRYDLLLQHIVKPGSSCIIVAIFSRQYLGNQFFYQDRRVWVVNAIIHVGNACSHFMLMQYSSFVSSCKASRDRSPTYTVIVAIPFPAYVAGRSLANRTHNQEHEQASLLATQTCPAASN